MLLPEWNPCLKESDFQYTGELVKDLCSFAEVYSKKVTPKMVKISLGLRSPDLYDVTKDGIREIPDTFKKVLVKYFTEMQEQNKIQTDNIENLAVAFLAINFGYVFFKASFGDELTELNSEEYIKSSIYHFVKGICKKKWYICAISFLKQCRYAGFFRKSAGRKKYRGLQKDNNFRHKKFATGAIVY